MDATVPNASIIYSDHPNPRLQQLIDENNLLLAENAALRQLLIDTTGQREVIRRELDKAMQERSQ